jgi:hypothetical protein
MLLPLAWRHNTMAHDPAVRLLHRTLSALAVAPAQQQLRPESGRRPAATKWGLDRRRRMAKMPSAGSQGARA